MKVFVYMKKDSKKIATINSVTSVEERKETNEIVLFRKGQGIAFDTKVVKCTIYQN